MSPTKKKELKDEALKNVNLAAESVKLATDKLTVSASNVQVKGGSVMKDKLMPLLVAAIVVTAFVVGNLYGKVSVYERGEAQRTAVKAGDEKPSDSAPAEAQAPASLTDEQWNKVADFDAAAAYKGNKDAKVVMVEFTDYECPFCARYFSDSYKSIVEKYVDTNKIAYINRDLPLSFHKSAESAALAARCAGDQGKYYEMHDLLFEIQTEWTTGDARDAFVKYAGDLGLNTAEFESCYDNGKFVEEIKADAALASSVGANGTPTFFINGEKLVGAQPIATFEQAIEAALGN